MLSAKYDYNLHALVFPNSYLDTDSDILTSKKKQLLGSDSGSDDDEGEAVKQRQRLPSDSGSDPEAVRATAEDIFGEADDISEDEKDKEQVSY